MRKSIFKPSLAVLLLVFSLCAAGCEKQDDVPTLKDIPKNYSLEQAKADGCVVHENGDVTSGKEIFEIFYKTVSSGKKAKVRLAFYCTLDDPSHYDPDYYESIKDDYPALYIQDLSFDGEKYTLCRYEDGNEIVESYDYIMKYNESAMSPYAVYDSLEEYVLTNDNTVTYQDIMKSMLSSRYEDHIEHDTVCCDYIYK